MKILTTSQAAQITEMATTSLAKYIRDAGIKSIVMGISGGIDSAVVAALAMRAISQLHEEGYEVGQYFTFLDVHSKPTDLVKAQELADALHFPLYNTDLSAWYDASPLLDCIPPGHERAKVAQGNIKCRLRMIALYHFAQLISGIYLDTDDLSEEYMGFWTRHGDEGDLKIIQHLTKVEVYDLGEYLCVPPSILQSEPGDGLGVTDANLASDQLGLPYMKIDYIISRFLQNGFDTEGDWDQLNKRHYIMLTDIVAGEIGESPAAIQKVLKQALKTAFKRRYGDNVCHLLPDRLKMGLPVLGYPQFNEIYLAAIKKYL